MKNYFITKDCVYFIYLNDFEESKRLANCIKGAVYVQFADENLLVHSYSDQ